MGKPKKITRIELLVLAGAVVFITVLTLLIQKKVTRPVDSRIACMTSLKQWGLSFSMYLEDNDGHFFSDEVRGEDLY